MDDDNNFFETINPDGADGVTPNLPEIALTSPLSGILPNEIVYLHAIHYPYNFLIDRESGKLFINEKAEISRADLNPVNLTSRLPLLRVLTEVEGSRIDGYIVDIRDTAAVHQVRKKDLDQIINGEYDDDIDDDALYVPPLAIIFEDDNSRPGFLGDERILGFGRSLLLAVNQFAHARHPSYESPLSGTYQIGIEDTEIGETQTPVLSTIRPRRFFNIIRGKH